MYTGVTPRARASAVRSPSCAPAVPVMSVVTKRAGSSPAERNMACWAGPPTFSRAMMRAIRIGRRVWACAAMLTVGWVAATPIASIIRGGRLSRPFASALVDLEPFNGPPQPLPDIHGWPVAQEGLGLPDAGVGVPDVGWPGRLVHGRKTGPQQVVEPRHELVQRAGLLPRDVHDLPEALRALGRQEVGRHYVVHGG